MERRKTVLVLGAGASAPFGFPTGAGLGDEIRYTIEGELQSIRGGLNLRDDSIHAFLRTFKKAGGIPTDEFLGRRKHDTDQARIGKFAIATSLLAKELGSALFANDWRGRTQQYEAHRTAGIGGNWYEFIWQILTQGLSFHELDLSWLSVVTFNYDRSLEHFLFEARYPDLDHMTSARLEEFLKDAPLLGTQKDTIRQASHKVAEYQEAIFWRQYSGVRATCIELRDYVGRHGIFFPTEIKEKFTKVTDELWNAVNTKAAGHQTKQMALEIEGWKKTKTDIEPLYKAIESDIHARLRAHGRS